MTDFVHYAPWIWLALAVLFAFIEAFTMGLTTIWFALGALATIFAALLRIPFAAQFAVFLLVSGILFAFTRPFAVKKLKAGRTKTNVDGLVGMDALVIKKIAEFEKGEIKLNGQIWSARSEDNSVIEENEKCVVVRIEGAHAVVKPRHPIA
jgi:membrane protein implicated in regulation of membrane protease activity